MGNLQTIVPSGPFDAARNPALLPTQTSTNSTGIFYTYIMHFPVDDSANYYQYLRNDIPFDNSINSNVSNKNPKINGMSGHIANVTKSGNYAIGFALTDNGKDQYLVTKKESSRKDMGDSAGITIINKANEYTKTKEYNPAFVASLGINISKKSFIGFQIISGYSDTKEEKEASVERYIGTPPPPLVESFEEKRIKETKKISSELGFGYLFKNNEEQFGLLFKTGEFSWIEKKFSAKRDNIYPSINTSNANSTIKMNGKYTTGPGVIAGAYKKLNPIFGLAFESGIKFENSYIDKDLEYNSNNNMVEEQKYTTTINNIYSIRAGLEINLINNLALALGIGYMTGLFESNQRKEKDTYEKYFNVEMNVDYGISTIGIQYSLNKNISIDLITAFVAYKKILNIRMREEDTSTNSKTEFTAEEKNTGLFLHTGLGVTLSF